MKIGMNESDRAIMSAATDEWETPRELYDMLDSEFHFTVDVASSDENAKCLKHYTKTDNGLVQNWAGETVWCNPPYGRQIGDWCKKCFEFSEDGGTAVMLLPARTDTKWFHEYVYGKAEIHFIRGRIKFGGSRWNAPFPSMVVIFKAKNL